MKMEIIESQVGYDEKEQDPTRQNICGTKQGGMMTTGKIITRQESHEESKTRVG